MPTVDIITPGVANPEGQPAEEPGPINTVVGIIYPPPEVRSILFETKIQVILIISPQIQFVQKSCLCIFFLNIKLQRHR